MSMREERKQKIKQSSVQEGRQQVFTFARGRRNYIITESVVKSQKTSQLQEGLEVWGDCLHSKNHLIFNNKVEILRLSDDGVLHNIFQRMYPRPMSLKRTFNCRCLLIKYYISVNSTQESINLSVYHKIISLLHCSELLMNLLSININCNYLFLWVIRQ